MSGVFRRLDGKVLPSWQHCTKLLAVYWKKVRYAGKGQFARSARDQCFRWALGGVVPKRTWDGGQNLQRRCTPAAADCAVLRHQRINVRPKDADKAEWFTADNQAAGSDNLCFLTSSAPEEVVRISRQTASRSRKARSTCRALAAPSARSIAGIPTAV